MWRLSIPLHGQFLWKVMEIKESCLLIVSFSAVARPCVALSDQNWQERVRELLFLWLHCVLGSAVC